MGRDSFREVLIGVYVIMGLMIPELKQLFSAKRSGTIDAKKFIPRSAVTMPGPDTQTTTTSRNKNDIKTSRENHLFGAVPIGLMSSAYSGEFVH